MSFPDPPLHRTFTAILPDTWAMQIGLAVTPEQIVLVARQFIDTWHEGDIARLPAGCAPPFLRTPQDVSDYAFTLTQAQLQFDGTLTLGLVLDRMTVFFTFASSRIAHLQHIARAPA